LLPEFLKHQRHQRAPLTSELAFDFWKQAREVIAEGGIAIFDWTQLAV
jgi:hypothetical protein